MWTPRDLYEQYGLKSVIIGGPADVGLCEELRSAIGDGALSLAGKTSPLHLLDLIKGAALFLGNDSDPAHIAGGVRVNTIVISPFPVSCTVDHPNSPQRFRPVGPNVRVLRPAVATEPCLQMCEQESAHCILQISSAEVLESICAAIDEIRSV